MTKSLLGPGLLVFLFAVHCGHNKQLAEKPPPPARKSELKYGLTKEQSAQALVKLGARTVSLGEFAERLGELPPYLTARYDGPQRRREYLDEMVCFELLAAEAGRRGYDRGRDVERVQKQVMVEQMMRDLFEKQGLKLSDISDAEIQKYYAANRREFEAQKRTLADARAVIRNRLWRANHQEAIEKFVADLRSEAGVQENPELLSKLRVEIKKQ
jgi:hypothetical protein